MSIEDITDTLELEALTKLLTGLFAAGTRRARGRATHRIGVGARGSLRVHDELPLPANEIWQPGRRFELILRHANLNNEDDLSADYRGAALRLSDSGEPVLDLLMNTGETTVWSHARMFAERMQLSARDNLPEFYLRHPDALERYWSGLRRAPEGYDTLSYYSKITYRFWSHDGELHACRYRLIPRGFTEDSGQPSARDREAGVLATERWPEETRASDLLRRAFAAKVREEGIVYELQIALRPTPSGDNDELLNPSRAWDLAEAPWIPLAELTLDQELPHEELELLRFDITHAPDCHGLYPATSATDYASIAQLRASLYRRAAAARPDR